MLSESLTEMYCGLNDVDNLPKRVSELERQNRRLRKACWLALLLLGSIVVMGQRGGGPAVVEATEFRIKDSGRSVRGKFGVTDNGPEFALLDRSGQPIARLSVYEDGSVLALADGHFEIGATLASRNNATVLSLFDSEGRIYIGHPGGTAASSGMSLSISDVRSKVLWKAP